MKRSWFIIPFILLYLASTAFAAPLNQIYQIIESHTVNPVDREALRQTPLEELAAFLNDPYFTYFSPAEFKFYLESHKGSFGGVGLSLQKQDAKLVIISVQPGSPADKAGLMIGDEIVAVDGKSVIGYTTQEAAMLLRGEVGTEVAVTFLRDGVEQTVTLKRAIINTYSVRGYMKDNVAVIEISGFTERTPEEFRNVLKALRLRLPDGLIVDVRGNPGGSLISVLEVLEELVPPGPVLRLRAKQKETVLLSENEPSPFPFLVVLIDEYSASAAEILAGAVQDSGAGVIVGRQSYGKGTVQSVFLLSDGGGLRLTTNHFYTPLGKPINDVGIKPDFEVLSPYAQLPFAIKLVKANARGQLVFTVGERNVWVNQRIIQAESPPFITNNRSYVPLRLLAESMGYQVEWDEEGFTATLRKGDNTLVIPLRKQAMYINGRWVDLTAPIIIRNNRAFLPARSIAEALGFKVYWNHDARQVTIVW